MISNSLFADVANATVPALRRALAQLSIGIEDATPKFCMEADITIEGVKSRVRLTVELEPEDDEEPERSH